MSIIAKKYKDKTMIGLDTQSIFGNDELINLSNTKICLYFKDCIGIDEYKYVELHNVTNFEFEDIFDINTDKHILKINITTNNTTLVITKPKNFEIQKYDNITNIIITI